MQINLINKSLNNLKKFKSNKIRLNHYKNAFKIYATNKRNRKQRKANIFKHLKRAIFIINILFLLSNTLFLFISTFFKPKENSPQKETTIKPLPFKSSDNFCINFINQSYQYISSYLNNKYYINTKHNSHNKEKKEIKVKVEACGFAGDADWLTKRLSDKFILKFDDINPDYYIYSTFTSEDMNPRYTNAIKIALYTENEMPDLNYIDYIFAHYHITYLDKYFKYNIFLWEKFDEIIKIRNEVIKRPIKKKFCAGVISSCNGGDKYRFEIIHKLNNYKHVDMGGSCENNQNGKIKDKRKFLSDYKFSIATENSNGDGYISEKLVDSFRAGTIPIYYGDYLADEYFNPKTYILIKGEKDVDEKIEYIKKIDKDDKLYLDIMKTNPFLDENFLEKIDKKEVGDFFESIFQQDKNKAFRRDDNFYDYNCHYDCH